MFYKGQSPVLLLNAPAEFTSVAADLAEPVLTAPKGKTPFVIAFATSQAQAKKAAAAAAKTLEEDGSFWLAYPKGTSKRYKKTDINRDSGHTLLGTLGFDGVSLVAIDDDWSAMRFKRKGAK
jgi:hypothetical protein